MKGLNNLVIRSSGERLITHMVWDALENLGWEVYGEVWIKSKGISKSRIDLVAKRRRKVVGIEIKKKDHILNTTSDLKRIGRYSSVLPYLLVFVVLENQDLNVVKYLEDQIKQYVPFGILVKPQKKGNGTKMIEKRFEFPSKFFPKGIAMETYNPSEILSKLKGIPPSPGIAKDFPNLPQFEFYTPAGEVYFIILTQNDIAVKGNPPIEKLNDYVIEWLEKLENKVKDDYEVLEILDIKEMEVDKEHKIWKELRDKGWVVLPSVHLENPKMEIDLLAIKNNKMVAYEVKRNGKINKKQLDKYRKLGFKFEIV